MQKFMAITKALADENRTRVLMFLRGGELCVCQIIELLGLAPSTVSKHLTILHQAGLIQPRKERRWIYYGLAAGASRPAVIEAIRWVHASLEKNPQAIKDSRRVEAVKKMDKDELCARYKGCGSKENRPARGLPGPAGNPGDLGH